MLRKGESEKEKTEEVVFNWTPMKIDTVSLILAPGKFNTNKWECTEIKKQYRQEQLCGDSDWLGLPSGSVLYVAVL